jgi:glyoxylase-like metal-dependent hydrolase (beta-lactamase superfamily II)
LLGADNKLALPNAEVLVPATEWKFWMDDGEMSRASKGRMEDLFKNNRRIFDALGRKVTPYEWNKDLAPGLTPIATVGHSIGHTSFILSSGWSKLYIQSDVTNHPETCSRVTPTGAVRSTRTRRRRSRRAARFTTCWWPTRCWCRGSTIRSRAWPASRRRKGATGWFRLPGARRSKRIAPFFEEGRLRAALFVLQEAALRYHVAILWAWGGDSQSELDA